ncbi:HAD hydrolase family protein [Weissella cibaria]|jgi:Predicted hydrolases of the HAD superfamily|nr:HAD hydrolase family protein [Weissella cibaria]RGO80380.1 haloacid dehalogenase [Weissella cibaria]RHE70189.1 haloacid dehalogenase [Weissella cibaria]RHE76114.1 haloacid dehalogenase [Weissella cibaria]
MKQTKFVATDLDGTFLNDQKRFNRDLFAQVLKAYEATGGEFIVASGRDLKHVQMLFGGFLDRVNIVADNGATILSADGQIQERHMMTQEQLSSLQHEIDRMSVKPHGGILVFSPDELLVVRDYGAIPSGFLTMMASLYGQPRFVDSLMQVDVPVMKVTVFWTLAESETFVTQVRQNQTDVHATTPGNGVVDVMAPGVDKAASLQQLLETLGGTPSELAVFGDGMNDLEMLAIAGQPIIMPNADKRLFAYDYAIAVADNNHDGVLQTWQELI